MNKLDYECTGIGFFKALAISLGIMFAVVAAGLFLVGCGTVKVVEPIYNAVTNVIGGCDAPTTNTTESLDDVPFSSLVWQYGGFNGTGATLKSGATISNLQMSSNGLHFDSVKNVCVVLGASSTSDTKSILVCFFCKDSSGAWRGGKFDWIADNRGNRRDLNHITGSTPYGGWSASWIPNPCECAFVLVNNKTKSRSNVIEGTWKR